MLGMDKEEVEDKGVDVSHLADDKAILEETKSQLRKKNNLVRELKTAKQSGLYSYYIGKQKFFSGYEWVINLYCHTSRRFSLRAFGQGHQWWWSG